MNCSCYSGGKLAAERVRVKESPSGATASSVLAALKPAEFLLDDGEQWFEAAVNGIPNGPVEYKLIVVAIDVPQRRPFPAIGYVDKALSVRAAAFAKLRK